MTMTDTAPVRTLPGVPAGPGTVEPVWIRSTQKRGDFTVDVEDVLVRLGDAGPKAVATAARTLARLRQMHRDRAAQRVALVDALVAARAQDVDALVKAASAGKPAPESRYVLAFGLLADHEAEGPRWSPAFTRAEQELGHACAAHRGELDDILDSDDWQALSPWMPRPAPVAVEGGARRLAPSVLDAQAMGRSLGDSISEGRGNIDSMIAAVKLDPLYNRVSDAYWAEVRRYALAIAAA